MSQPKIAVQMMMFKEVVKEQGLYAVLEQLKEMGYSCVEMSQIPTNEENMAALKKAISELGMEVCALSASTEKPEGSPFDSLKDDFDKLVKDAKDLNCNYIRLGIIPPKYIGKEADYLGFAETMNMYGKRLKEEGIKLYYHNHEAEFEKFNGKTALDILMENTDTECVGFELDVHWVQRGGQNPVKWIKKLEGRADIVHLKDFRINTEAGSRFCKERRPECVEFAEIGEGNLDFEEIIQTCIDTGVKYMPIEQDRTYDKTSFEALATSMKNIKAMGFENNF